MTALLDSNVLIAASVAEHPHRPMSQKVMASGRDFVISAHSLAEVFSTLTKPRLYGWSSERAWLIVHQLKSELDVRYLNANQQFEAVRKFAGLGGVGAQVHDYLIGHVASVFGLDVIITINARDFRPLFPQLTILTPAQYLETL